MYTITNNYGVETRTNSRNRLITEAWDSMQASVSFTSELDIVTHQFTLIYNLQGIVEVERPHGNRIWY